MDTIVIRRFEELIVDPQCRQLPMMYLGLSAAFPNV